VDLFAQRRMLCASRARLVPVDHPACNRQFAVCVPEGQSPGKCSGPVTCDATGPSCPSNTTPGILNGCFTGACIPLSLCEVSI
jgi:hypothetical protein